MGADGDKNGKITWGGRGKIQLREGIWGISVGTERYLRNGIENYGS